VARDPSLPTFIQWDVPEDLYPGAEVVAHRVQPSGIAWLALTGDEEQINAWVGSPDFDLRIEPGTPSVAQVGLAVDGGEIVLG
jgi:hypothetical protein